MKKTTVVMILSAFVSVAMFFVLSCTTVLAIDHAEIEEIRSALIEGNQYTLVDLIRALKSPELDAGPIMKDGDTVYRTIYVDENCSSSCEACEAALNQLFKSRPTAVVSTFGDNNRYNLSLTFEDENMETVISFESPTNTLIFSAPSRVTVYVNMVTGEFTALAPPIAKYVIDLDDDFDEKKLYEYFDRMSIVRVEVTSEDTNEMKVYLQGEKNDLVLEVHSSRELVSCNDGNVTFDFQKGQVSVACHACYH